MTNLQITWFFLLGVLITGYALLDGFDLGVGFWYLFHRRDRDRRTLLAAIGPVWDGNEVWLILSAGAIFAAFPPVYATVFSGLYLALMLVLFALIFRATAIEFRNKLQGKRWRHAWDWAFGLGSSLAAILFGVAVGNLLNGLPLDDHGNYTGSFLGLLNPFSLLVGLLGFAMITTHGGLYIAMKTERPLSDGAIRRSGQSWWAYLVLFVVTTLFTLTRQPRLLENFTQLPVLWLIPVAALTCIVLMGIWIRNNAPRRAFFASCVTIIFLMGITGSSLFPNLVPASNQPELSLTLANASSSQLTLKVMLIIVLIGMPLVLTYTIWVYRRFAGKATVGDRNGYGH